MNFGSGTLELLTLVLHPDFRGSSPRDFLKGIMTSCLTKGRGYTYR